MRRDAGDGDVAAFDADVEVSDFPCATVASGGLCSLLPWSSDPPRLRFRHFNPAASMEPWKKQRQDDLVK